MILFSGHANTYSVEALPGTLSSCIIITAASRTLYCRRLSGWVRIGGIREFDKCYSLNVHLIGSEGHVFTSSSTSHDILDFNAEYHSATVSHMIYQ